MQLLENPTTASLPALTPRLVRRDPAASPRSWLTPGFGASAAFINLSPGLVCAFDGPTGEAVTHQELGAAGMTAHQAWNAVAEDLAPRAFRDTGVEFMVRPPSVALGTAHLPRGFEVGGHDCHPASWLAHPKTFTILHRHFESVLQPAHELVYVTRDGKDLFVFDGDVDAQLPLPANSSAVTYSVGFPLLRR